MEFKKVLTEVKISVLANSLKNNNPVFDKTDQEISKAIGSLTGDDGKLITDINVANQYVKKLGLDPVDPKVAKVVGMAVRAAAQEQQSNADITKIEAERAAERNARRSDLKGQVLAKGYVQ